MTSMSLSDSHLSSSPLSGVPGSSPTLVAGGTPAVVPGVVSGDEIGNLKESGEVQRRETRPRKVRLEYLVLNLEHLRPVLGVICRRPDSQGSGAAVGEGGEKDSPSMLDFSGLKQAHIYVWDSEDGHAVWSIIETARRSLERLTLRYFDCEHLSYTSSSNKGSNI